jgi:hypothetical protein
MINENMKATGRLNIVVKDKDGNVKDQREETNLVVTTGLAFITSRMTDAADDVMSHMAIGTGTTAAAAGDSALGTEVHREALDSTTDSSNTIAYVSSFEANEPSSAAAITEAGIFNAASGGTMLCRTVFDAVNKDVNDTMTITWTITLTAS